LRSEPSPPSGASVQGHGSRLLPNLKRAQPAPSGPTSEVETLLPTDASLAYSEAGPQLRRRWNQVFFTKLFVGVDAVAGAELTDEFGALLADDLAKKLKKLPSNPKAV